MSGACCSPLGPGSTPGSAFRIQDDGSLLPAEPALNVINGDLADDPGAATNLTLYYQFVANSDGPFPQRKELRFSDKFVLGDSPGFDATDVDFDGELLPSVGVPDAQDVLAVNPAGVWATAANGFLHFTTTALRNAYPGLRTEGMLAYVADTQCLYMLAPDLTTWLFFAPSPALAAQAAWAIDAATGSDNNTGAPGAPLATTEELGRRLCPRGGVWNMTVSVAIAIAAGSYGALELTYAAQEPLTGLTLAISCAFTSVADTLTSVINTTAATQGRITLASGAGLTARMRIRSTSGASIGAITYGVGALNAANDSFVKSWTTNVVLGATVNIANGTTVALDTLGVTIARCILRPIFHTGAQIVTTVSDGIFPNGLSILQPQGSSTGAALGCLIQGGRSQGNVRFVNCKYTGSPQLTGLSSFGTGNAPVLVGCAISQATLSISTAVFCNLANCFDASSVVVGGGGFFSISAGTLTEFSNGAGLTAITIGTFAQSTLNSGVGLAMGSGSGGQIIGFGTAYAIGYNLESGTSAVVVSMAVCQIPSTINVKLSGNARTYAQLPGYYGRANCFFSIAQDTTAAFTNT